MGKDYNSTINLPKTDFPMRAGLPKREPGFLAQWQEKDIYNKLCQKNAGKPPFILHDGPPFSNGYIHMGTAMNKVLKDIIVRNKNMNGYYAPYVPGWDNHGMPIESAIIKQNNIDRKQMSIPEFRNACHEFAQNFVDIQMGQFKRLGVLADWDHPYLTMTPSFEAEEVKVFGEMYKKGYIYKGLKPVYWCAHDETALAEAEIEYNDDPCKSVYVKFKVVDDHGKLAQYCSLDKCYFVIWTTTVWTLPGNLAICLNENFNYVLLQAENGEVYIVAEELASSVCKVADLKNTKVLATLKGSEFELMTAQHPFMDRTSIIILGDHVTLESGTGCVHTAPGHGMEDYIACRNYDLSGKTNIGIIVPVDDKGRMTAEAGKFEGLTYTDANTAIFNEIQSSGALLAFENIVHQYPHCWRCKEPVIYRATDQWFCSVDAFKEDAVKACESVTWTPDWGGERIVSMVRNRADWCISRQRHWGLPIPVFYCPDCGKPVCTPETIETVSKVFGEQGSNAWYELPAKMLLPTDFACPHCGSKAELTKETDTLDGWFDSGSSHFASLAKNNPDQWPADLYLEGGDQYRGWFQSSLLTSTALRGVAPYRNVLTHGWVVDGEGKAMHKSLGNSVAPEEVIEKYGGDILRLWVATSDYRVDVRVSDNIFKQLSDMYLKIRNTARFILGNLDGFCPDELTAFEDMEGIDRWAISRLNSLIAKVNEAYKEYEFHTITHSIHNFCVVDMSNFYLDIIKDRLYCEERNGALRRSAQSAMYIILDSLVRMLAPILAFTSDEIWSCMIHDFKADSENVMFNSAPQFSEKYVLSPEEESRWDLLLKLRTDVNKALEAARAEKTVGKPLDAEITLYVSEKAQAAFDAVKEAELDKICIVSSVEVIYGEGEGMPAFEFEGINIAVKASENAKCLRCWTHHPLVGRDNEHPDLCPRCLAIIKAEGM